MPRITGVKLISLGGCEVSINCSIIIRVGYLDAVVSSFGSLMAAHRGEVVCSVTTAKALDGAMKKDVEGAVKGFLKGKEKALITWTVDPKIIGGMVGILIICLGLLESYLLNITSRSSLLETSSVT